MHQFVGFPQLASNFIDNQTICSPIMPRQSKRRAQGMNAVNARWNREKDHQSSDDVMLTAQRFDEMMSMDLSEEDHSTPYSSDEEHNRNNKSSFRRNIHVCDMRDIFQLCEEKSSKKNLSVLLYLILRYFKISFEEIAVLQKEIGALSAQVAHKWAQIFLEGDFDKFCVEGRGGKRCDAFYDVYPEIEAEAKAFSVLQCQEKSASFTAMDLAHFIDRKYYEITSGNKTEADLVRSVESCRIDLRHWGARFESNSLRPYFEGHDRPDVLAHRSEFIRHFPNYKRNYYTITPGEDPSWQRPKSTTSTILICRVLFGCFSHRSTELVWIGHDESTFRSGEVRSKRWIMEDSAPFFNKGQGRSLMVSDFLVQHPSGPYFRLSEEEWTNALQEFPDLSEDVGLRYERLSATAMAHIGIDSYFDNCLILQQFERLFRMLKHKKGYQNHKIEILVDNARTHTAKEFSINDFGKGIGSRCPVSSIEFISSDNQREVLDCYFHSGTWAGRSKGLLVMADELGLKVTSATKLDDLRKMLLKHPAFNNVGIFIDSISKVTCSIQCPRFRGWKSWPIRMESPSSLFRSFIAN